MGVMVRPLGRTPPTVSYDIKAILRPLAGQPYLGFTCDVCKGRIAMLDARRIAGAPMLAPSSFDVQCPHCKTMIHKSSTAMERFVA